MASNGRDAYMTFDSLTVEGYSGVFDLVAREILRQREREAVQAHLAQAVSHSDDVKAELAAANARLVSAQGLPVRPTPGLSLPACYPLPACCGGSA